MGEIPDISISRQKMRNLTTRKEMMTEEVGGVHNGGMGSVV